MSPGTHTAMIVVGRGASRTMGPTKGLGRGLAELPGRRAWGPGYRVNEVIAVKQIGRQ
jgi:hypothetical protein